MDKNHLEELSECILTRNEKTGEYTLGREDFDRLYGINDVIVLSPDSENVARLASVTYLMGMADYEITAFVAIAAGYLATFKDTKDGTTKTLLISGYEGKNIEIINKIYREKGLEQISQNKKIVNFAWQKRNQNSLGKLYTDISTENPKITQDSLNNIIMTLINKVKKVSFSKSEKEQGIVARANEEQMSFARVSEEQIKEEAYKCLLEILAEQKIELAEEEKQRIVEYFYSIRFILSFERANKYNCDINNLLISRAIFNNEKDARLIFEIYMSISNEKDLQKVVREYFEKNNQKVTEDKINESIEKLQIFIKIFGYIITNYFAYMKIYEDQPKNNNSELLNQKILEDFLAAYLSFNANTTATKVDPRIQGLINVIKNNRNQKAEKEKSDIQQITKQVGKEKDNEETYYMMVLLINLCATDYTADAMAAFMRVLAGLDTQKSRDKIIPQTSIENTAKKKIIRNEIAASTPFRR